MLVSDGLLWWDDDASDSSDCGVDNTNPKCEAFEASFANIPQI